MQDVVFNIIYMKTLVDASNIERERKNNNNKVRFQ
jgi:hypothetical protein